MWSILYKTAKVDGQKMKGPCLTGGFWNGLCLAGIGPFDLKTPITTGVETGATGLDQWPQPSGRSLSSLANPSVGYGTARAASVSGSLAGRTTYPPRRVTLALLLMLEEGIWERLARSLMKTFSEFPLNTFWKPSLEGDWGQTVCPSELGFFNPCQ